ncbi:MAG: DnaJ domain-containing protein [Desulfobacterales bacterium]|nr:DnaJ domain-containing protein [Desulfobacterales bacterium]
MERPKDNKIKIIKIVLSLLALIYIISPVDLIPDFFPLAGWLDDAFVAGVILYFLKRGAFPVFLSWFNQFLSGGQRSQTTSGYDSSTSSKGTDRDPYDILGIKPGASPQEIHTAYRQAAQAYHPDKVSHLGPELQELAEKKFVEIQRAYEKLIKPDK